MIRMSIQSTLLLVFITVFSTQALAETCETNPGNCTPVQLCEKSTEVSDGKTYWTGDETNSYLKVARQFGLDCGALDALPTCQRDANTCAILELCEVATAKKGSKTTWNLNFESHVKLAKSFGLNCEVSKAPDVEAVSTPTVLTPCDKNPAACISETLCKKAADTSSEQVKWRVDTALAYVEEAKKRKLDCTAKVTEPAKLEVKKSEAPKKSPKTNSLTPCDKKPAACISEMLCEKAAETSNGKVKWRSQTAPKYVAEAKKRKLDCQPKIIEPEKTKIAPETKDKDVPAETGTSNKQLENLFEKKDFQKLRIGERKQLQYGLKKLGYYKGAIDGLYGPMSQNAVRDYAQDKDLVDGYPDSVLAALISEPGVGINFAKYFNQTAHFNTVQYQDYDIFPIHEIICRSVFQAPWVGLKDLDKIKQFLSQSNNKCRNLGYQDVRYWLGDMPEAGVRIDLDNDGIRDLLVFLYGFQQGAPLKMVGFKFGKEKTNDNQSPIVRLFRADEIFASREYPTVQNARFISVSDFNSDGEQDVLISDGGYDTKPFTTHHSKILLSSPNGFIEQNIGPRRKRHGLASGDINGDGFIDVLFGRSQSWPSGKHDTLKLYMNDGDANFKIKSNRLPRELITTTGQQPVFVEFLDIDSDGFIDLVSGQPCGKFSKIFWNDGRGYFTNKNSTIIPLKYQKHASTLSGACQKKGTGPYNTIDQVFLVKESKTNKRYFGTVSSRSYRGRSLSLFRIEGRSLSPSLTSKEDPFIDVPKKYGDQFAYKMAYNESSTGHRIDIFDFSFNRISLKFDPISERYQKVDPQLSGKNVRMKFDYNMIVEN